MSEIYYLCSESASTHSVIKYRWLDVNEKGHNVTLNAALAQDYLVSCWIVSFRFLEFILEYTLYKSNHISRKSLISNTVIEKCDVTKLTCTRLF